MTLDEALDRRCSCHLNPPCSFCMAMDEGEADAHSNGGRDALIKHITNRDAVRPFYLFADTETTGLPLKGEYGNPAHPETPHLVELAAILTDASGLEVDRLHTIVRPDGYEIPVEASNIHGITQERALAEGVPLWRAMWQFERLLNQAAALVFHNHQFDRLILKGAHHRLGIPHRFREVTRLCTMQASTKPCAIAHTNGRGGFKWPTLTEAHTHFLGTSFEDAHGAMADAEACMRVFFKLKERALI